MADDQLETRKTFEKLVNMTPMGLSDWLKTDESKSVGQASGTASAASLSSTKTSMPTPTMST